MYTPEELGNELAKYQQKEQEMQESIDILKKHKNDASITTK